MAPALKPKTTARNALHGGKVAGLPLWAWGGILATLVGFYLYRRSSSGSSTVDAPQVAADSGDESDAQTPSGGGGSSASNLPDSLVNQPDPLSTQVQQNDTTNPESPQSISGFNSSYGSTAIPNSPGYVSPFSQPPATYIQPPPQPGPPQLELPPTPISGGGGATIINGGHGVLV